MAKGSGGTGRNYTPLEIENTRAAGKFARGFEHTVLSGRVLPGKGIEFDFAPIISQEYKPGKMSKVIMQLPQGIGAIYSGYAKKDIEFKNVGAITKAKFIKGKTFEIKDQLKKHGFSWNANKKQWEK